MATIDSNGVLFYQDSDNFTPPASLNLAQSNLSSLLGESPRFKKVANTTARTALVSSIGLANITPANPLLVWRANAAAGSQLEYTTNGTTWEVFVTSEYLAAQDTGWVACTINGSGWTNVPSEPVQVRRIGKHVYMRGAALNSTLAQGTTVTMGNVPTGFRPSQRAMFSATLNSVANLFIRIETNGNITAGWYGTGTTTGAWWGFNNVVYTID